MASRFVRRSSLSRLLIVRKGHDHHAPMMPPFARLKPAAQKLPTEIELIWDDGVAPETAIDFDAPHVSTKEVLLSMLGAAAFFASLYAWIASNDPVASNPVATRDSVIPYGGLRREYGLKEGESVEEEEEE